MSRPVPKPLPADPWQGFMPGEWQERTDVNSFILCNFQPFLGDDRDLTGPTERTQALWLQAQMLQQADQAMLRRGRATAEEAGRAFGPNYIDHREELIFGMRASPASLELPVGGDCRALALYGARRLRESGGAAGVLAAAEQLALCYGLNIESPAATAQQALQWISLWLLVSRGPEPDNRRILSGIDAFLDTYLQRDIERGLLIEEEAQELIDDFVIKLRLASMRGAEHSLCLPLAGSIGPMGISCVTRTSFRLANTFYTLGPAAEPCFVVLWSGELPEAFRIFSVEVSIDTCSLRYARSLPLRGESCTLSLEQLGQTHAEQVRYLCQWLDQLADDCCLGVNILRRENLLATLARPNRYAYMTVQMADRAVDIHFLSPAQRQEVLSQLLHSLGG